MAQVVETTIANNVTGMEEIAKLVNTVGELRQEQKRLAAAMSQMQAAGDKLTKSTHNVASATKAQAAAASELRNRLDPMFAAQKRFNQQMDEADRLYEAGIISLKEYTAAQKQARDALRQHAQAVQNGSTSVKNGTNDLDAQSKASRRNRQAMQMAGMQIGDFATQVTSGANPVQAFNQQLGQLGYALSTSAKPRLAAVGNFLAGPWSIAVLGATMILGPMIENMLGLGDAADESGKSLGSLEDVMKMSSWTAGQLAEVNQILADSNNEITRTSRAAAAQLRTSSNNKLVAAKAALALASAQYEEYRTQQLLSSPTAAAMLDPSKLLPEETPYITNLKTNIEELQGVIAGATFDYARMTNEMSENERTIDILTQRQNDLRKAALDAAGDQDRLNGILAESAIVSQRLEAAQEATRSTTRSNSVAQREANEALRKALKLEKQMIEANVARASSLANLTKTMKKWEEETEPKGQKPKTYQEVLATLEKIETLEIKTPKGLQDIIDKNAEVRSSFEAIGNAVANGFKGMITGAQSFGSAMKGIIQSVIDELFRLYVVQQIVGFVTSALSGAFGGGAQSTGSTGRIGGFRALGGSVSANTPYVVGEKGPELFMPSKSGTIIPNQNLPSGGGGGSTFNISVDARGSSDPEAVRQQVQQGILEAAPSIVAAAQNRTINTLRRPRLAGAL